MSKESSIELLRVEASYYPIGTVVEGPVVADHILAPAGKHVIWTSRQSDIILYTANGIFFNKEAMRLWILPVGDEADGMFTGAMDFYVSISSAEQVFGPIKQQLVNMAMRKMGYDKSHQWDMVFFVMVEVGDETCTIIGEVEMKDIVSGVTRRAA